MTAVSEWLSSYGHAHGLDQLSLTEGESLAFNFDDGLCVHVDIQVDEFLVYASVGHIVANDAPALEGLLSANLMWRDTDGATLSLEPYSRAIVLARAWPIALLASADELQSKFVRFCHLANTWRQALVA